MNIQELADKYTSKNITIAQLLQGMGNFKKEAKQNNFPIWVGGEASYGGMKAPGTFQFKLADNGINRAQCTGIETGKGKAGLIPSLYIVPMKNGSFIDTDGNVVNQAEETLQGSVPISWLEIWNVNPNAIITAKVKQSGDFYNVQKAEVSNEAIPTTSVSNAFG